jgi:hypothetical protein
MDIIEKRICWLFIVIGFGCFVMAGQLTYRTEGRSGPDSDQRPDQRAAIIRALGQIGSDPKTRVPFLVEALKDKSPTVRRSAVEALGQIGAPARDAVPALLTAYKAEAAGERPGETRQASSRAEPHPTSWGSAEGFAVAGGLCFLAAGLVFGGPNPARRRRAKAAPATAECGPQAVANQARTLTARRTAP